MTDRATSEPVLLSCRGVTKRFGAMAAVSDLHFDVTRGEVLGIGGPNGAGKTTLFEVISGLNPVTEGEIELAGERIEHLPPHAVCHRGIARVFQSNASFETLTARQNVLVAAVYGRRNRLLPPPMFSGEVRDHADEALAFAGLLDRADSVVANLPVLDRKLLMVAGALASQPRLILMDEPVGGLNPHEIDRMMGLVRKMIDQGITIMLIEHVMRFLVQLSSRIMILHHGEKIYEGSPGGLATDETVKQVYLGESAGARIGAYVTETAPV